MPPISKQAQRVKRKKKKALAQAVAPGDVRLQEDQELIEQAVRDTSAGICDHRIPIRKCSECLGKYFKEHKGKG